MNEEIKTGAVSPPETPGDETATQPEDKFPRGTVIRYFAPSRYGFIKDRMGRDIYFNLDEVRFVGDKGPEFLREGIAVGYDVGWTSHGLHVTYLKIF